MDKLNLTAFRLVDLKDGSHGVEVTAPNAAPVTITGFSSRDEARAWLRQRRDDDLQAAKKKLHETARAQLRKLGMTDAQIDAELAKPPRKRMDVNQRAKSIVDQVTRDD